MTSALNSLLAGLALAGTLAALAVADRPSTITGPARVIDGDTIVVAGLRVRLWGIDAPEADQTCLDASGRSWACGEAATTVLRQALANGVEVACEQKDIDRYGRVVATCRWQDIDLGQAMVGSGYAVDYPRYSKGHYAADQAVAQRDKIGIWSGTFELPWDWRRTHPRR